MDMTASPLDGTQDEPLPTRIPPTNKRGGVWVTLGDEAYRIPPIAFRVVQEMEAEVAQLADLGAGGRPTPVQMAIVEKLVLSAIQRNYPDMTQERIAEMIDVGNYMPVLNATLGVSGYVRRAGSGEALPSAPTGTGSTPA